MKTVGRLTQKGYKTRETRRKNQVRELLGGLNIGSKDFRQLEQLLTKDVRTKKGLERSKLLEKVIFKDKDFSRLSKFKEFKKLKEVDTPKLKSVTRLLQDDADFYINNQELIKEYNKLSKTEKSNKRNLTRISLERDYSNYKQQKRKEAK